MATTKRSGKRAARTGTNKVRSLSPEPIQQDEAADAACLVGELHLSRCAFAKAVEAFTRALETHPTVDAYEGRARAYRGLAAEDERRAAELRDEG